MIDEKKLIAEIRELKNHYDFFYKEGRSEVDDAVKNASDTLFNDVAKIIYKQPKADVYGDCKLECEECRFNSERNGAGVSCTTLEHEYPEKAVEIVEKWAAEHPAKTRQSEFLKKFPNATPFHIDPCNVDTDMAIDSKCRRKSCIKCREEYWNAEVE